MMANHLAKVSALTLCRCVRNRQSILQFPAVCHRRLQSTATIPPPHIEGTDRTYPTHISSIVDQISQLSLLEVADLNELLKKTLNISDAPMMAMGGSMQGAQAAQDEEEAEEVAPVQSLFTVKLIKFDDTKKVALIKEIKALLTGMNLVQAKKFVESAPAEVKKDISKEEAETLKKALEAVGGTAEIE